MICMYIDTFPAITAIRVNLRQMKLKKNADCFKIFFFLSFHFVPETAKEF